MRVTFDQTKQKVVFVPEDSKEMVFLEKLPAFKKISVYFTLPAVSPVVYNVLARTKRRWKNVRVDPDLQEWLDKPWKLEPLPEDFFFYTKPKNYQEIALRYLHTLGSAGLLLDPGMGKSKVVLDYIFLRKFKRSLVVCPKALLFVWEDEIGVHRPELTFYVVKTTDWEKELPGILAADVTIINYTKAAMLRRQLETCAFEFMHLDEFLIKDPSTTRTQELTALSYKIPFKAGGSGTLVNNTPLDSFGPVRYICPELVGWNFTHYKEEYAVHAEKKGVDGAPSRKVVVAYRHIEEIRAILDSCCIVMTKERWLPGMVGKKFFDIWVRMSETQSDMYDTLRSNYICEVPDALRPKPSDRYIEVDNPLTMMSKLYQVSNGFAYINDDPEDSLVVEDAPKKRASIKNRRTVFFQEQPKIEALEGLLSEKLRERRCIIWFNLSAELELIQTLLMRMGLAFSVIKGGEKDTGGKVRQFNRDKSLQFLVCQAKSVNYGVTVLGHREEDLEKISPEDVVVELEPGVYTQIFYSLNFSLEMYSQQQDRTHRLGQEFECEYYRLFSKSPVELQLKKAMEDKLEIRQSALVDVAGRLEKLGVEEVEYA